ncbi:MAG TPA: hypothetical protein VM577_04980, partial [Anaerovoracaceae bacterium]|nr:hypothetical protein [Anaerovoracaceae bacterium]
ITPTYGGKNTKIKNQAKGLAPKQRNSFPRKIYKVEMDKENFLNVHIQSFNTKSDVLRFYGYNSKDWGYADALTQFLEQHCNHPNVISFIERSTPKKVEYPPIEEIHEMLKTMSRRQIAKQLGCSLNSVLIYINKHK